MQRRWMGILVLVGMALSAGCGCSAGGGGGQKDAVADQGPGELPPGDVPVTPDGGPDVVPDGIPDAAPDGVADVTPEGQVPDVPTPDAEPDATGTPLPYSFATYNTGLAINFVPLAPERFLPVVDAVSKLEAEVVCLQEVWEVDHVIALRDKVKAAFPYSLYVDTTEAEGGGAPACTAEELKPLQDCVLKNCATAEDLTGCVMQSCLAEFGALQPGCTQCLAANLSKPLEEIFATCTTASAALSYQGRNGLILLSKRELDKTEHLVLDAFLIRRVVLHATFKDDPAKTHVFCTHLSAALSEMEYAGKYASWEEEQAAQIDQMLEWVDQQAGKGRVLVLGDMNCGPEVAPDITAAFPENYAKFDAAGYGDPYSLQAAAGCTWCTDNTLVEDTDANQIIDHVLIQGLAFMSEILTAERILDDLADVTVGETPQKSNLSDHFGVWVHE